MSNKAIDTRRSAIEIAQFLHDHRGERTIALYLGDKSGFTDYFVITTARSQAHLRGLVEQLHPLLAERELRPFHPRKRPSDDGWILIDCGPVVVHVMTADLREFYDLERLWFGSELVFEGGDSVQSSDAIPASAREVPPVEG